jgi:hypothetical protein
MALEGWYYLHTNGEVIFKREVGDTAADIRESDFARAMWPCDPSNREGAWNICVEALSLGAIKDRVKELSDKWQLTDEDAPIYADRVGAALKRDGNAWCATRKDFTDLQESPAGFGDTALEALAALCKEIGYKGGKMWNATFKSLLKAELVK